MLLYFPSEVLVEIFGYLDNRTLTRLRIAFPCLWSVHETLRTESIRKIVPFMRRNLQRPPEERYLTKGLMKVFRGLNISTTTHSIFTMEICVINGLSRFKHTCYKKEGESSTSIGTQWRVFCYYPCRYTPEMSRVISSEEVKDSVLEAKSRIIQVGIKYCQDEILNTNILFIADSMLSTY